MYNKNTWLCRHYLPEERKERNHIVDNYSSDTLSTKFFNCCLVQTRRHHATNQLQTPQSPHTTILLFFFSSSSTTTQRVEKEHAIFPPRRHAVLSFITRLHVFFFFLGGCAIVGRASIDSTKQSSLQESVDNKSEENGKRRKK